VSGAGITIETSVLRDAATSLNGLAGDIKQTSTVDLTGCGSSRVAQAAADFDMWLVLTGRMDNERIEGLAQDATVVADEADRIDAALAAAGGAI
jgi:hypothetical protein